MRVLSFFVFAIILLGAGSLRSNPALFDRVDRDGDGVVTATELPNVALRGRYDRDSDGSVSREEFLAVAGGEPPEGDTPESKEEDGSNDAVERLDRFVAALDRDGDGAITRDEAGGAEWFDRVDRDKDGTIGKRELTVIRAIVKRAGRFDAPGPVTPSRAVTEDEVAEVTSGPEILKPGDVGIGRMVADAAFSCLDGSTHRLSEASNHRAVVIAMTSATCPVSKRYLPTLATLEDELAGHGIPLVLVNPFASESEEEIRAQLEGHDFAAPYVHDKDKSLSLALGAETTTEVFLIDSKRTLVYRGAIDDQYGIDYSVREPRVHYLRDALTAFLGGERPGIAATAAPGCEIDLGTERTGGPVDVTYHRDVARILQQNCVECHHEGGIAPFALDDHLEVDDRARVIARVVREGTMPPWFAAPPEEGPSPWANDRSLSERDKADLLAWLDSKERPVGDPADAPEPVEYSTEWSIGEPDLVLPLSRAYDIPATGFLPYRHDVVETNLTEDKWVTGYEILPSERDVVHHVIVQVFEKGTTLKRRAEGSVGYWAAYVPGNGDHVYPEGFARKLPAGSRVQFQIHYTPSGKAKKERLKMGLVFAKEPPRYEVRTMPIADHRLNIPPGAEAHVEGTKKLIPFDLPAMSFLPHMHTRGAAFRYEVTYPGGEKETLLDIPRYDFNWQLRYDLKEPKLIPRGSTIEVTGVFDNSERNRANPDPTQTVRWGSQTVDEMLIGYIEYFIPREEKELAAAE